jgi:hypothetical protein
MKRSISRRKANGQAAPDRLGRRPPGFRADYQDAAIYASILQEGEQAEHALDEGRIA